MPITQTPLRYPGGKSKLYKYVVRVLEYNNLSKCVYVEPFAGGAGLALSLLIKGNVKKILINDSNYSLFVFWYCVLNKTEELVSNIEQIPVTIDEWLKQREIQDNPVNHSIIDMALSTFFLNRTNRSGILKGGVIGGLNQTGNYKLDSRFNKEDLIRKIRLIGSMRDRIKLSNLDVFDFIPSVINGLPSNTFMYFDPPYIIQGGNLYLDYFERHNHENLSILIKSTLLPWMLTYDNHPLVYTMYKGYNINEIPINYSAGTKRIGTELLIFNKNVLAPKY